MQIQHAQHLLQKSGRNLRIGVQKQDIVMFRRNIAPTPIAGSDETAVSLATDISQIFKGVLNTTGANGIIRCSIIQNKNTAIDRNVLAQALQADSEFIGCAEGGNENGNVAG